MKSQRRFAPEGVRNEPESMAGFIGISRASISLTESLNTHCWLYLFKQPGL
jgi:hypothetical protein